MRTVFRSRCPACGRGALFENAFEVVGTCDHCGARLERDPGSYLVLISLNYFLVVIATGLVALALVLRFGLFDGLMPVLIGVAVVAFALLFRPTKALYVWLLWVFGFVYPDDQLG